MENEQEKKHIVASINKYMEQIEAVVHPMRDEVLSGLSILIDHQEEWTIDEMKEEFSLIKEECPF